MSHPPARPNPDVSHDLGKLLKQNPRLFNVLQIGSVRMTGFLRLELDVVLASHDPVWGHVPHVKINCLNAVDYAIRPKPPEIIEGGKYVEYYEEHPRLLTVSPCVPHSDGREQFKPTIRFKLLALENTWVIAERFELLLSQV